jgi:hypothetical protein
MKINGKRLVTLAIEGINELVTQSFSARLNKSRDMNSIAAFCSTKFIIKLNS